MKFNVPDMSCGHCTSAIEKAIKASDSSADVSCDLSDRTVTISAALSENQVTSILKDAGYEAVAQ